MVQINFARREVNCKIVYYGPGLSGKTTNLEKVHEFAPKEHCGKLTSIATEGDRTLFFDFMPLNIGTVAGMNTKFQLYTVPGQTFYESTRRLVLQGADGVVFVADSQKDKFDENLESFENLRRNLKENGLSIEELPLVIQYNKRDLPNIVDVKTLDKALNADGRPYFEGVAVKGTGVMQTLKAVSGMVLETLNTRHRKTRRRPTPDTSAIEAARDAGKTATKEWTQPGPQLIGAGTRTARAAAGSARSAATPQTRRTDGHSRQDIRRGAPGEAFPSRADTSRFPRTGDRRPLNTDTAGRDTRTIQRFEQKKTNGIWIAAAVTVGAAAALVGLLLVLFS